MIKIRLQITKGEAIRYISHLDYARTVERALRRAKLPVAYSEGFNPHMKLAFASALAVGVTSDAEYMDIELMENLPPERLAAALAGQLPAGIVIRKVQRVAPQSPALMKIVNWADYTVAVPLADGSYERTAAAVEAFRDAPQVIYTKETPKGKREIDLKRFLAAPVEITGWDGIQLRLTFAVHITPAGSVKPREVLDVLVRHYGLPIAADAAVIHRTGLFVNDGRSLRPPI
ncbi:MAG: TIGR03936 family radical SAM-associated protein [Negativicutes bacterium]|nr:TIGR03936 family radical SAM-associated protein [Negativicutes bacterium]